ncbi:ABC transporter permease [Paenibacillus alvei]|uniref:ABC transporter permease n=1 Tax=Paenibacillus alvei TaxID=44250 RepID=UPI0018CFD7F6|nr:ABC transporter permease [Paenibacillus alvei]MBG9735268.1 ABC transporter permease [Paenibacillus alvei]MBG9743725.1 ABC transporter permease [Paenibacillus alvei]MCY9580152.1 ABC transporter permease [Paenibacillus alvei]MCY9584327.1 ABC transporter permease [Paenibacillus alvei]
MDVKLSQGFKMSWHSIRSNKLRTFLSMLGILIGVATVISLMAMGQGSSNAVEQSLQSLGTNQLSVNIMGRGSQTTLTLDDAVHLADDIPDIEGLAPTVSGNATVKNGTTEASSVSVEGITPDYERVKDFKNQSGRYIVPLDVTGYSRVALLGVDTAAELFKGADPTGQTILLNGVRFKVIGLLEPKGSSLGGSNDEKVLIPITTAQRLFQSAGVRSVGVKVAQEEKMGEVAVQLEAKLTNLFRGNTDSFNIFNQQDVKDTMSSITKTLSTMMAGVACISLIIGGIGIMNIMLVSVTERTREIGIRKSLGAKKRDILLQFLIESVVLSGMGGLAGIGLAYAACYAMTHFMSVATAIQIDIVLYSFAFSAVIGILFGIFPANKAASLKPVDALRHD